MHMHTPKCVYTHEHAHTCARTPTIIFFKTERKEGQSKDKEGSWGCSLVAELMLSMSEALGSLVNTNKEKQKV